eukprot:3241979-Pyramimonas_sp.AAC.1
MYMNTLSPDAEGSMVIDNVDPAVELPHVHVMDVLGVRIDKRFRGHDDMHRSYYYDRSLPLRKKIARCCSRVQACFLCGIEGATIDSNSLKFIHAREGGLLANMLWWSERREENWTLFLTKRIRAGRALLHRTGRESLVQRVLRKQWEWAKDISDSLCHVLPPPPPLLPCSSTMSTPPHTNNRWRRRSQCLRIGDNDTRG